MCAELDPLSNFERLQMGIIVFFLQKDTGAKSVAMATTYSKCHSVSFVMYVSGAKFGEHCSNISGDILD